MSQDYFSRLSNASSNSGGFEPGYPIESITAVVHPGLEKSKAFGFRFGAKKRWINGTDVFPFDEEWVVSNLQKKNKPCGPNEIEAARSQHANRIKTLLESAVVDKERTLFDHIMKGIEGGHIKPEALNDQFIFESVAAPLAEAGRLYAMTEMAARNSAITNEHVEQAKAVTPKKKQDLYFSGRVRMILFSQWGDFEGKTPPERPLPADFETIDMLVRQLSGEVVEGGQEPPADVNGPPPF